MNSKSNAPTNDTDINPYESPNSHDQSDHSPSELTFRVIGMTLLFGVAAGMLCGVATNSINGTILPSHFRSFTNAYQVRSEWIAAMIQGGVEGAAYGVGNAVVLIVLNATFPRRLRVANRLSRIVVLAAGLVIVFWLIGGIAGLATQQRTKGMPSEFWFENWVNHGTNEYRWVMWSMRFAIWGSPLATLTAYLWVLREKPPEPAP